jgi:cytochrome c oxidase subunit 2
MKLDKWRIGAAFACAVGFASPSFGQEADQCVGVNDILLTNGKILTVDEGDSIATTLRIKGNTIDSIDGEQADAPRLSGRQAEYLIRQLRNFKNGLPGYLPVDIPGNQMALMSTILVDDEAIQNVVAYIQSLPDTAPPPTDSGPGRPYLWRSIYARTGSGEASRGKELYLGCAACHGLMGEGLEPGEGIAELGAPRLRGRQDWYLIRQLKYFRDGVRGSHPGDVQGQSMAGMARVIGSRNQAAYDVVAYINLL